MNGMLVAVLAFLAACGKSSAPDDKTERPLSGVTLKVAVLDNPPLVGALQNLSGEWHAQTDGALEVEYYPSSDARDAAGRCDIVIFPSDEMGEMAELLSPLGDELLRSKAIAWNDIFEALRLQEARWGESTFAVPFTSPQFVAYCHTGALDAVGLATPTTWSQWNEAVAALAAKPNDAWLEPFLEPLAGYEAALTFLARAASYAKHRDHYSTLFRIDTFDPLIDTAPFVRALEELVATHPAGAKSDSLELTPHGVVEEFFKGRAALAISWPSPSRRADVSGAASDESTDTQKNASESDDVAADSPTDAIAMELPGSPHVYHPTKHQWMERSHDESHRVTFLPAVGMLGAITRSAVQPQAAAQFLALLSSRDVSQRIIPQGNRASPIRTSQIGSPLWNDSRLTNPAAAAEALAKSWQADQFLAAPRIPGQSRYMEALSDAVRSAVTREASPQEALTKCAEAWREISANLGIDKQRAAYLASLGLLP